MEYLENLFLDSTIPLYQKISMGEWFSVNNSVMPKSEQRKVEIEFQKKVSGLEKIQITKDDGILTKDFADFVLPRICDISYKFSDWLFSGCGSCYVAIPALLLLREQKCDEFVVVDIPRVEGQNYNHKILYDNKRNQGYEFGDEDKFGMGLFSLPYFSKVLTDYDMFMYFSTIEERRRASESLIDKI